MKHIVELPACNGLRLVPVELARNPLFNRLQMDDVLSNELYQDDETPIRYTQKWQMQDGIAFQVSTNANGSIGFLQIFDCMGIRVAYISVRTSVQVPGNVLYGQSLTTYLYVFSPGEVPRLQAGEQYYATFSVSWLDGHQQTYVSEVLELEHVHPQTILLQCRNSYNKADFIWEQFAVRPSLRVEGALGTLKLGGKNVVADDATFSPVLLSSTRWRGWELRLGNGGGIPDWMADKVDAILDCDSVYIEGRYFVREEGSPVSIKPVDRTAARDASVKLREQENGAGARYNSQRKSLGTIPAYPFLINEITGAAIDLNGNTFSGSVYNRTIANDADWLAVLATLNGTNTTYLGNGGYFVVANGSLYFQTDNYLEIISGATVFAAQYVGGTVGAGGSTQ